MNRIEESATMALSSRAAQLRQAGVDLVDLGAGEPGFPSPATALQAVIGVLEKAGKNTNSTSYTAMGGIADLRSALAERYDLDLDRLDLLVTVGAKAALLQAALALLDEGDQAIIPSPCWVSLPDQVKIAGAQPVLVPMDEERGFFLTAAPLVEAITPRTRVVIVNSPCNPTGAVMARSEWVTLVEECRARDVAVVADDTYERFVYDGREVFSATELFSRAPEHLVVVGCVSKTFAMTGWRIGWAIASKEAIARMRVVQGHATSNATTFAQFGAAAALRGGDQHAQRLVDLCRRNRQLVVERLAGLAGVRCPLPEGSFYAFVDVRGLLGGQLADSASVAGYLLDQARVAVVPGEAFGASGFLRLSFAADSEVLSEGLSRMVSALGRVERVAAAGANA